MYYRSWKKLPRTSTTTLITVSIVHLRTECTWIPAENMGAPERHRCDEHGIFQ